MRRALNSTLTALFSAALAAAVCVAAAAADGPATERPAALDANQGEYAVIAPIFTGADGSTSFIRLFNVAGDRSVTTVLPSTIAVAVVGSPSGTVYGTANIQVAGHASPQYSISEILALAGAAGLAGGDTAYSLYLSSAGEGTGFMHVIFNGNNGFFENASACQAHLQQPPDGNKYLFNVHTSRLTAYPTQVYLHNYDNVAHTFKTTVRDSRTGTEIGSVNVQAGANATISMPFTSFEQQLGWTPATDQQHANMMFEVVGEASAPALVTSFITNQALSASIHMTTVCQVNGIADNDNEDGDGGGTGTVTLNVMKVGAGTGSVTSAPIGIDCGNLCSGGQFSFTSGASVTLTASSAPGSLFQGWSGACSGTATTCQLTMNGGQDVTATFTGGPVALTVAKAGSGSGSVTSSPLGISCGNTCSTSSFTFNPGATVTLTATAASGSTFQGWSGPCSGVSLCTVTVSSAATVTATFAASLTSLTISKTGTGPGNVTSVPAGINCGTVGSDCTFAFTVGSTVTLTANALSGTFLGWSGGPCSGTGICSVIITGSQNLTAAFAN